MGALVAAHGTTHVVPGPHADMWFLVLDQRMLHVGLDTWIVQVLGIHSSPEGLWIQLASIDEPHRSFVLQVDDHTTVADVTAVLRARTSAPEPLEIIRVPKADRPQETAGLSAI
jgi:hypothetical protein